MSEVRIAITVGIALALSSAARAQSPDSACGRCLAAALPGMIDSARVPGVAAAVIADGRLVWSGGAGVSDTSTRRPVTDRTVIRAASLGKPVFAYGVLALVDQGRIALDTPLVRYAPASYIEKRFLHGPISDTTLTRITARMVLSHTTGLPNWRTPNEPIRVAFAPGSRYSYSGEGFFLLQRIVEHLTGKPVEEWMQETVLRPLGMTRTSYAPLAPADGDVATAYSAVGTVARRPDGEEPNVAYTMSTTAADYARFLIAVMGGRGLRPETARAMLTAQTTTDVCRSGAVSFGLGFALERRAGADSAFVLWGRSPDATGYLLGLPSRRSAVVYLTNVAARGHQIGSRVVKLALGYDDALLGCFGVRPYDAPR